MSTMNVYCEEQYVAASEATEQGFFVRVSVAVTSMVSVWAARTSQRHQLAGLSDYMLKDIGITRAEAEMEAHKPFWKG